MNNRIARPYWWMLYMIVPMAVICFMLEIRAPLTEAGHRAAEVGILLLAYGLVEVWFLASRQALLREEREKYRDELLRASASNRPTVETGLWISTNGNGRVRSRGLARFIPAWLLAAFGNLAGFFHQ